MSLKSAATKVMQKVIEAAPDKWMPGGKPDPILRKHGAIGTPVTRIDGPLKVSGAAPFAAEFAVDEMLYAAVAFSTIAKGRITTLDTTAAEAAPGVHLVMTYKNAPRIKPTPLFNSQPKAAGPNDLPIMQDDSIHWNGEAIAVVLADTQEQADYAKSLISATYAESPASIDFDEASKHPRDLETILGEAPRIEQGHAEVALAAAPVKVDLTFHTPRHNHNPIELHAVTLYWKEGKLYIHDASQAVVQCAWTMAEAFGLKEDQVHVSSPYVGGGFGSKTLWQHHILAAAASKLAGRPVRMVLSREGVYRVVGGRTLTEQRVAIGAQLNGLFDALIQTGVVAMGRHNNMPEPFILPARSAYAAKSFKLDVETAQMDMLSNTFMRAPG